MGHNSHFTGTLTCSPGLSGAALECLDVHFDVDVITPARDGLSFDCEGDEKPSVFLDMLELVLSFLRGESVPSDYTGAPPRYTVDGVITSGDGTTITVTDSTATQS